MSLPDDTTQRLKAGAPEAGSHITEPGPGVGDVAVRLGGMQSKTQSRSRGHRKLQFCKRKQG